MVKEQYTLKGGLWVELGNERVLGPGRVELLERIDKSGSIRQAALQMGMSYAMAWKHIDHMNTCFGEPVVTSQRGGKGGGRAELTPKGKQVIQEFKIFYEKFQAFLTENSSHLKL